MAIDYEDKPPGNYNPSDIAKRSLKEVVPKDDGLTPKTPTKFVGHVVKRFTNSQEKRTIESETSKIDAQTTQIEARTRQDAAMREHTDGMVRNALHTPVEIDANIRAARHIAQIDRSEAVAEREHAQVTAQKRRAEELNPSEPEKRKYIPKPKPVSIIDNLDDFVEHGTMGISTLAVRKKITEVTAFYENKGEAVPEEKVDHLKIALNEALDEDRQRKR